MSIVYPTMRRRHTHTLSLSTFIYIYIHTQARRMSIVYPMTRRRHTHTLYAVHSSVLIWLDSFPPSASAFISGS